MCQAPLRSVIHANPFIHRHLRLPFKCKTPSNHQSAYHETYARALPRPFTPADVCEADDWQSIEHPSCLLDCSVPEVFANLTTVKALRNAVQSRPLLRDDLISLGSRPWLTEPLACLISNSELAILLDNDPEFRCEVQIFLQRLDQRVNAEDVAWLVQALYKVSVHPVIYSIIDLLEELMNPDRLASVDEAIVLGVSSDRLYTVIKQLNAVPAQQLGTFIAICRDFWTDARIDASLDFLDHLFAAEDQLLEKLEHTLDVLLSADKKTYEHFATHQIFALLLKSMVVAGNSLSAQNLPVITAMYDAAIQRPQLLQAAFHKVIEDRVLRNNSAILLAALHTALQPCIIKSTLENLPAIYSGFQSAPVVVPPGMKSPGVSRWQAYGSFFHTLSSQALDNLIVDMCAVIVCLDQKGILDLLAASQLPSHTDSAITKLFLLFDFFFSSPGLAQKLAAALHVPSRGSDRGSYPGSVLAQVVDIPVEAGVKLCIERVRILGLLVLWRVMPAQGLRWLLTMAVSRVDEEEAALGDDVAVASQSGST